MSLKRLETRSLLVHTWTYTTIKTEHLHKLPYIDCILIFLNICNLYHFLKVLTLQEDFCVLYYLSAYFLNSWINLGGRWTYCNKMLQCASTNKTQKTFQTKHYSMFVYKFLRSFYSYLILIYIAYMSIGLARSILHILYSFAVAFHRIFKHFFNNITLCIKHFADCFNVSNFVR